MVLFSTDSRFLVTVIVVRVVHVLFFLFDDGEELERMSFDCLRKMGR